MLAGYRRSLWLVPAVAALAACQSAPPPVREAQPEREPPEQLEQIINISPETIALAREVEGEPAPAADERYVPLPAERPARAIPPRPTRAPAAAARSRAVPGPSEEVYLLPMARSRPDTAAGKGQPLAAAEAVQLDINPYTGGTWISEGGTVTWMLRLRSVGASSLSLYFNPLRLPPGSELLIASPDGATRHGPYTAADIQGGNEFWTPSVPGEITVLSLRLPQAAQAGLKLNLAQARIGYSVD